MRRATSFGLSLFAAMAALVVGSCTEAPNEPSTGPAHIPVALAVGSAPSGAMFATDKDDYVPGDTVRLEGMGWQAGDSLDIHLDSDPQNHPAVDWSVGVDPYGRFWDSTYVVQESDAGVTFTLTATSRATGETATAIFFDFGLDKAFITSSPSTATANSSVTITAGATRTTSGNATIPTWAGTSYAFSTTNTAPSGGSFVCLAPAKPSPGVAVNSTSSASPTSGGSMSIPTTGLVRGSVFLFIRAEGAAICNGASSDISAGQGITIQGPDLSITKTHSGNFTRGSTGTYTINVSNVGEAATSGLTTVTDVLPSQFAFSSITATGWTCTTPAVGANGTISCTRNDALATNFNSTITLVVSVAASGGNDSPTNTATVANASDVGPGNNSAGDPTQLAQPTATKLVFTSSVFTIGTGVCSPQVSVQTRDAGNSPTDVTADVKVNLSSTSGGGTFYSDNTCTNANAITFVTISAGNRNANFFYKDTNGGDPTLTAADNAAVLTSATQQVHITAPANQAPIVNAGGTYSGNEGSGIALDKATANDPNGDALLYSWTSSSATCTIAPANTLNPTITCNDNGSFTATLSVDDQHGHVVTSDATVNVSNVKPSGTFHSPGADVNEGSSFNLSFTGASDASSVDQASLRFAFDCGAGYDADDYASAGSALSKSCTAPDGPATLTVKGKVLDKDGGVTEYSGSLTVKNVPPTATFEKPTSVDEGSSFTLKLKDASDPSSDDLTAGLHYTFDCGNGSGYQDNYGASGTSYTITCNTATDGPTTLEVKGRVFDKDGGVTEYKGSVTVNNVPPTATFEAPTTVDEFTGFTLKLKNATDVSSADLSAGLHFTFDCGNGSGYQTTYAAAGTAYTINCSNTTNGPGTLTVKGKVFDKDEGATEYTTTVTVNNVPPTITSITTDPTSPLTLGLNNQVSATVTVNFTDPAAASDAPYGTTIDCGNGTSTTGTPTTYGMSSGTCTYTIAQVGKNTISATVTDKDNGSDTETLDVFVYYRWTGFFQPVDNPPAYNSAKAGSGIPVKFNLNGNQGLNIFDATYPKPFTIACDGQVPQDPIEETVNAGQSSLTYDEVAHQYIYVWKTDRNATGCRRLDVKLKDGSTHSAYFKFAK